LPLLTRHIQAGCQIRQQADSLSGDTGGAALKILSADEEKEAHKHHIKKTYPDADIAITTHRLGMDDGMKVIAIGYRNNSKHDFLYVDFVIQLFDGQGREIAVPDSDKTIKCYGRSGPGESKSDVFRPGNEIARAKTVKVKVKK